MFDQYSSIFDKRGQSYHQAMLEQPQARIEEFNNIIKLADLEPKLKVFDIPSGGGYLKQFIDCDVDITQVETSKAFYQYAQTDTTVAHLYSEDIAALPVNGNVTDRIISLSGLHHIEHRAPFYKEAYRVIAPGGLLCIADVAEGSDTDRFLNVFVDQNGSEGHEGLFINQKDIELIESAGFVINQSEEIHYHWNYESVSHMVDFTKKMFGIDQCSDNDILEGIQTYLGYELVNDQVKMPWSLRFIQAEKVSATE